MLCLPTDAPHNDSAFTRAFGLAEQLRQSKKSKILLQKRHKLYSVDDCALDVHPDDFLHVYNHDMNWFGTLQSLAKFAKCERKLATYVQQTPVRVVN